MSDRPAPKFQVGEEVYALSHIASPGKWITGVIADAKYMKNWCPLNACVVIGNTWGYRLEGRGGWCQERDLRKPPQPSTQSFTELLQSIQQPNKVKA